MFSKSIDYDRQACVPSEACLTLASYYNPNHIKKRFNPWEFFFSLKSRLNCQLKALFVLAVSTSNALTKVGRYFFSSFYILRKPNGYINFTLKK